jgi:signal transduction histidine kinase
VNDRPRELTIASAPGPDGVVIEVRDSGIGLDTDRAGRVFEAFYTTKAEGVGIGLSISRSIVEAHGGRLEAAPNEPHGAVFRFSLPIAEDGHS